MKRHQFLEHLRRHGCKLEREGGRHSMYVNRSGEKRAGATPRRDRQPIGTYDLSAA